MFMASFPLLTLLRYIFRWLFSNTCMPEVTGMPSAIRWRPARQCTMMVSWSRAPWAPPLGTAYATSLLQSQASARSDPSDPSGTSKSSSRTNLFSTCILVFSKSIIYVKKTAVLNMNNMLYMKDTYQEINTQY